MDTPSGLTIRELLEVLKTTSEKHLDDRIYVTLSIPAQGPRAWALIVSAHHGFDWEHGQFRLEPQFPLVPKDEDDFYKS
ncbi:MAG: hypothetical protein Q8K86_07075 [Candidatus Nanopelagicaceae bacterium]|nr:hypothetical protein [Candidatus Nanopelagicaceae bacterium]